MSNFSGHFKAGLISSTATSIGAVVYFNNYEVALSCGLATLTFSLFPDVDVKSVPSKIFYWLAVILGLFLFFNHQYYEATIFLLVTLIPQLVNHRGILHSKLAACTIPGAIIILFLHGYISLPTAIGIYICGVIGYFTHLLMDH